MTQAKLTYENKDNPVPIINRKQQSTAEDFNDIKSVVNFNADDVEERFLDLSENQITGVEVYTTFADEGGGDSFLPVTGTLLVSYKVSNDPDSSKNGYYHWSGSVYIKDSSLYLGEVAIGDIEAVEGGKIYAAIDQVGVNEYGSGSVENGLATGGARYHEFSDPLILGWGGWIPKPSTLLIVRFASIWKDKTLINSSAANIDIEVWGSFTGTGTGNILLKTTSMTFASYAALADGERIEIDLGSDVDVSSYPFIGIVLKYDVGISFKQVITATTSKNSNSISTNLKQGLFYQGGWNSQSDYGLAFELYSGVRRVGPTVEPYQAVELDVRITALEPVVASNEVRITANEDEIVKIEPKTIKINGSETKGDAVNHFFDTTIWGWGGQIENENETLKYITIKRDTTYSDKVGVSITAQIYGGNTPEELGVLVHSFLIDFDTYAALSDGEELTVSTGLLLNIQDYKYITLGLLYNGKLSVKQAETGFIAGFASVDGNNFFLISAPTYCLWWQGYDQEGQQIGLSSEKFELPDGFSDISTLASNFVKTPTLPSFLKSDLKINTQDNYIVAYGDSITAWQSGKKLADEGVTEVPAVCDRQGLAYRYWKYLIKGSPLYRRFDYGKDSLVHFWEPKFIDDSGAFFLESGVWNTFQTGGVGRPASIYTAPNYSTEIANEVCPIADFNEADSQTNIPKRISNSNGAYVEFTIPAGFEKFDFIHHQHVDGDLCTVSVTGGNGEVLVNTLQNDWGNGVEANGYALDTVKVDFPAGFNDDYGIMQKRIYFKKIDIDADVTVRITKSSNTAKWLMYWGVTYWGTKTQPFASHLIDTARGGKAIEWLIPTRDSDVRAMNPDFVLYEHTLINNLGNTGLSGDSKRDQSVYISNWNTLKSYINTTLGIEMMTLIPHVAGTPFNANPNPTLEYYEGVEGQILQSFDYVVNVEYIIRQIWETYYSNESYYEFIQRITFDAETHPNLMGFDIFDAVVKGFK